MSDEKKFKKFVKGERDKLKDLTFKQKLEYFKDYYLLGTVVVIICVAALIALIISVKNNTFITYANITVVNGDLKKADNFKADMQKHFKLDGKSKRIVLSTDNIFRSSDPEVTAYTTEKIFANMMAHDIDLYIGLFDDVSYFAKSKCFYDLETYFSEEELAKIKEKYELYYYETTMYDEDDEPYLGKMAIGIIITDSWICEASGMTLDEPILCIPASGRRDNNTKKVIDYILK